MKPKEKKSHFTPLTTEPFFKSTIISKNQKLSHTEPDRRGFLKNTGFDKTNSTNERKLFRFRRKRSADIDFFEKYLFLSKSLLAFIQR